MARPEGFEPPTLCLEGRRSFQLSYGRSLDSKRFRAFTTIHLLPFVSTGVNPHFETVFDGHTSDYFGVADHPECRLTSRHKRVTRDLSRRVRHHKLARTGQFRRIHIDENRIYQACGLFSSAP
jgi:hypothetical protein